VLGVFGVGGCHKGDLKKANSIYLLTIK